MSEPKPEYKFSEGVLDNAILEQMKALHEEYGVGKREGEFTIQEYGDTVGASYEQAKTELAKALDNGQVLKRTVGSKAYYRMET